MTDFFSLLRETRAPWVDGERLKAKFLELSSAAHPDRFHTASESERESAGRRYAEVNEAYQALREPRSRLLHLLELEVGTKPKDIQRLPPGTMDLFVEVGQVCREVDGFLEKRRAVTSPMLKVRLFAQGLEWTERLQALQGKVNARGAELDAELQRMNAAWESAPSEADAEARRAVLPLARLEEIYRVMSYAARWTEQIQERSVQLASF
ncbi:MAG: hypothetical protein IT581_20610 [Verrucomicrobiales bacterium]|nr:hypothetical protein [Verrucomicrobiales bacterium]